MPKSPGTHLRKHIWKSFGILLLLGLVACSGADSGANNLLQGGAMDAGPVDAPAAAAGPTQPEGNIGPQWDPNPKAKENPNPAATSQETGGTLQQNTIAPVDHHIEMPEQGPPDPDGPIVFPQKF